MGWGHNASLVPTKTIPPHSIGRSDCTLGEYRVPTDGWPEVRWESTVGRARRAATPGEYRILTDGRLKAGCKSLVGRAGCGAIASEYRVLTDGCPAVGCESVVGRAGRVATLSEYRSATRGGRGSQEGRCDLKGERDGVEPDEWRAEDAPGGGAPSDFRPPKCDECAAFAPSGLAAIACGYCTASREGCCPAPPGLRHSSMRGRCGAVAQNDSRAFTSVGCIAAGSGEVPARIAGELRGSFPREEFFTVRDGSSLFTSCETLVLRDAPDAGRKPIPLMASSLASRIARRRVRRERWGDRLQSPCRGLCRESLARALAPIDQRPSRADSADTDAGARNGRQPVRESRPFGRKFRRIRHYDGFADYVLLSAGDGFVFMAGRPNSVSCVGLRRVGRVRPIAGLFVSSCNHEFFTVTPDAGRDFLRMSMEFPCPPWRQGTPQFPGRAGVTGSQSGINAGRLSLARRVGRRAFRL